jgi:hypothetical protein
MEEDFVSMDRRSASSLTLMPGLKQSECEYENVEATDLVKYIDLQIF